MTIKTYLCLLGMLMLYSHAQSQEHYYLGQTYKIASGPLEDTITVRVQIPPDYESSNKNYPVLYLLDGQRFFLYGASLQSTYQQYRLTPDFIVVGIETPYPVRFSYFTNKSQAFIDFIDKELIPTITENYRVSNESILFGWEYGGSLGFNILNNHQRLFDGYLLASPFPIENQVDTIARMSFQHKKLVFAVSPNENTVNRGTDKLDSLLSLGQSQGLEWSYYELSDELHRSTPYPTLYHGVKEFFKYYPELQIDNLEDLLAKGGLSYVYEYNRIRAEQYGFPEELSAWTRYTVIRSAMWANDYERFKAYSETLNLENFFPELADSRINELADYISGNEGSPISVKLYKYLLEKHPNSINLLNKLGRVYQALGNPSEANIYLKKAADLKID